MMIPILIIIVIILLIIGISLILKGMWGAPDAGKVVPLTDFYKIKTELKDVQSKESELKQRLDSLSVELEQAKGEAEKAKSAEEKIQKLRSKENECQIQIRNLERDLRFLSQKADEQAKRSLNMIRTLNSDNETLRQQQGPAQAMAQLQQNLDTLKVKADAQARESSILISTLKAENVRLKEGQGFQEKLAVLEEAMGRFRQRADQQAKEAMSVIQTLADENQQLKGEKASLEQTAYDPNMVRQMETENLQLKKGLHQVTESLEAFDGEMKTVMMQQDHKLRSTQEALDILRQENEELQRQLSAVATHEALQIEMQRVKTEGTVRLQEANTVIQQLRDDIEVFGRQLKENDELVRKLQADLARSLEETQSARNTAEELRSQLAITSGIPARPAGSEDERNNELALWLQERLRLQEEINRLQEANVFLTEKEHALHVKLTQSRAQAMGLEKLLRDFLPAENSSS
jgi:chromosome segregation ATPase